MAAITPDDILRPGRGLEPAGATSPANLARLLDGLGLNVDPDRAAEVQATVDKTIARAQLSKSAAESYGGHLRAMAGYVADSDLLGPNAWDGTTLPVPLEVAAVYLAEKRTDQEITRGTAEMIVAAVVWVNRHGRFPDQLPSEAQDTTGWPTIDSVPVIADLIAGWDVDLSRWQCQAVVADDCGPRGKNFAQVCRADTPSGRCPYVTWSDSGLCQRHKEERVAHPFDSARAIRRCALRTTRPDQRCCHHANWQVCRALSGAGDRCRWPTGRPDGLCIVHRDAEAEFDYEPGPTDPTPIEIAATHKADPLRARHIEVLAWTNPAHQQRADIIHAAALLHDAGVPFGALVKLGRDDCRFDDFGQVTFSLPYAGQQHMGLPPSEAVNVLRSYYADTGRRPTIRAFTTWRNARRGVPGAVAIAKSLGCWPKAVEIALSGEDPPPDPRLRTFTVVGGHPALQDDPVAALRTVFDNPACADKPFSTLSSVRPDTALLNAARRGDRRWKFRIEVRDSALILVGWWWGIRAAELVSLRLDQFEADPDLEVLWMRYNAETNKTNRDDRVARRCTCDTEIVLPVETEVVEGTDHDGWFRRTETVERRQRAQRPGLCPIRALCEWLACEWWLPPPDACGATALIWLQKQLAGLDDKSKSRPVFPIIKGNPGSVTPLLPERVGHILRRRLDRCDNVDWVQSHALRRGQATEMRAAGVDWDDIMDDLGWKTKETAYGYVDLLDDPDRVSPGTTALRAVLTDDDTNDVA